MIKRTLAAFLAAVLIITSLCGCGGGETQKPAEPPVIAGTAAPRKAENTYAESFTIYEYENGDSFIATESGSYLVTDSTPGGLDPDITVIPRHTAKVYMAASAVMCFYDALGKLGDIRFSALDADDWYVENAAEAMNGGDIVYAGKYRDPDYELLLSGGCDLSVQSTMTEHVPKVREKLTELGIPVFVDRSSYEKHPLGRCEWIKVYAHLTGSPELGDKLFDEQKAHFDEIEMSRNVDDTALTQKTAVFFYITASGKIVTRKAGDYINKMIELAGGKNVFDFIGDESAMSSTTVEPEQFCLHAKDADIIIYNSTISGEIGSIAELTAKEPLLSEFRAVKNGDVWCTDRSMYQDIMKTGEMLTDFHTIFSGSGAELIYLYKLR